MILATGHSSRDIYDICIRHRIALEMKPIAMGVRVEHPQELINRIQDHGNAGGNICLQLYSIVRRSTAEVFIICCVPEVHCAGSHFTRRKLLLTVCRLLTGILRMQFRNCGCISPKTLDVVRIWRDGGFTIRNILKGKHDQW